MPVVDFSDPDLDLDALSLDELVGYLDALRKRNEARNRPVQRKATAKERIATTSTRRKAIRVDLSGAEAKEKTT